MARRIRTSVVEVPASIPIQIPGVGLLQEGTVFSVKGSHGRYRFTTSSKEGTVVECFGGIKGHDQFRAFRPEQVNRIFKGKAK